MKYGFIYEITNLLNNKKYIGFKVYSKGWETYMGSCKPLTKDIKKLGIENFKRVILEECDSLEELQSREIFHLTTNNVIEREDFYNLSIPHPKFRKLKGYSHSNKGKTWEEIYGIEYATKKKEALINRIKGKTWAEICGCEQRAKERLKVAKGEKTEETKRKISEGRKGMVFSKKHRANLRKARLTYLSKQNNN